MFLQAEYLKFAQDICLSSKIFQAKYFETLFLIHLVRAHSSPCTVTATCNQDFFKTRKIFQKEDKYFKTRTNISKQGQIFQNNDKYFKTKTNYLKTRPRYFKISVKYFGNQYKKFQNMNQIFQNRHKIFQTNDLKTRAKYFIS